MSKYILSLGLTLALASLQAQTSNNGSQHPNQAAQHEQAQNQQSQMKNHKAQASDSAYRVLDEAYRAQQALGKSDQQTAKQDVNRALNTADQLNGNSSQNGIVPLYTEIGEYTLIGPRQHNGQTNSSAANNKTSKDNSTAKEHPVAVRKVEGDYTAITFNVKMARNHLEAAKQALDKGDTKAANDALAAVQDAVVEEEVATDLPLVRSRENLMLARTAANRGDYKEAHTALQAASKSLDTYAEENGTHASDAKQLRSEIDNYNASIQQNHSDASTKIEGWWNQVTDWNANSGASNQSNSGASNQSKMNRKNLGNSASNNTPKSK